jgi:hypothetical protein
LEASVEELSSDTAENFRSLKQDISQLSDKVDLGFRQAHAYIDENMATKGDVGRLEARFDRLEATQTEQGQKLDSMQVQLTQILTLLQQKPS